MDKPVAELAACFQSKSRLPDQDLVRLTAAARAAGSRWDAIAAACGIQSYQDLASVAGWGTGETGADLLFSATQHAVEQLTGSRRRYPPLTWACPHCGQQVTDRAASGRPIHIEHGHAPGCGRLARDQSADDERRREQVPRLILHSEPAVGPLQRHWLRERIEDDCPRCGWRGYFHHYLATVEDDTANMIAPPAPCRARESWSIRLLAANPHSADAQVNTIRPIRYISRRPYMSARLPAVSKNAARVSAYASTIHCRSEKLECSACWMFGRATVTIVTSSSSMKVPRHTATSVHHLFPRLPLSSRPVLAPLVGCPMSGGVEGMTISPVF
jgi:hypothetical protein